MKKKERLARDGTVETLPRILVLLLPARLENSQLNLSYLSLEQAPD